jgi:hypothetical protein
VKIAAACALGLALLAPADGAGAADVRRAQLHEVMNSVFGAGTWRETGGYRTPARENELRAQGALTVPEGSLSRHSIGERDAPGAYDVVVAGLTPSQAAERLRMAGVSFRTLLPEGAHGTQGPHLHLEPHGFDFGPAKGGAPRFRWTVAETTPAEAELNRLQDRGELGDADAQLRLGQAYASGRGAPRDLIAAYIWTALAASNASDDALVRAEADRALPLIARQMTVDERLQAKAFVRSSEAANSRCRSEGLYIAVPILVSSQTGDAGPAAPTCGPAVAVAASDGPTMSSR